MADRPAARGERASALVLAPALVLALFVLGGIAVDAAVVHGAQRSLHRIAAAAADDAAGMVDQRRLQVDGVATVDAVAATRSVESRFRSSSLPGRLTDLRVSVDGDRVVVRASVLAPRVFLDAVPGAAPHQRVRATVAGRLLR